MSDKAFITLLTTPSYLPGVLVLLHSLLDLHPAPRDFKTVCLVTPQTVDAKTIKEVRRAGFDLVIGVEPIGSGLPGQEALGLMGRPDLNLALTKLHLFRLSTLFHTLIYLDADVLPLRPLDHLFDATHPHVLSACSDTGWPDCFNSGVMVIRPRDSDFDGMKKLLKNGADQAALEGKEGGLGNGSFDGADQGLFNEWFSSEGGGGEWNRLSFTYNVTPTAAYQYAPAYKRYGHKINAVHFIGPSKPWSNLQWRPAGISNVEGKEGVFDYPALIDRWYAVYDKHVRPSAAHAPDMAQRFTVPETKAVWDQPTALPGVPQQPSDRMDLDALKSATAYGFTGMKGGQYTSLPLEGRVDLMMPLPPPPPQKPTTRHVSWQDEAPSAFVQQSQAPSNEHHHPPPTQDHSHVHHPKPHQANQPPSPPHSMWDAQRYSPPKENKPEMANAQISYYDNAWDAPPAHQSTYYSAPPPQQHHEPQYPTLPRNVVEDKWYEKFTGSQPDRSAIQPVFPWEEKQDHWKPSRVFPREPSPPPQNQHKNNSISVTVEVPTPPPASPQPPPPPQHSAPPPPPPPMSMDEAMASYRNAWDDMIGIERYIAHITGKPMKERAKPAPIERQLQSVPGTPRLTAQTGPLSTNFAHSHHETRSSASGDGDDEDDGEEDDSSDPLASPRTVMRRNKEVKLPSWQGTYTQNPKYRDRQSQTDRREMNDVAAQVSGGIGGSPVVRTLELGGALENGNVKGRMVSTGQSAGLGLKGASGSNDGPGDTKTVAGDANLGPASAAARASRQPLTISRPSTDKIPRRAPPPHLSGLGVGASSPTAYTSTLPTGMSPTGQSFAMGGYTGGSPSVAAVSIAKDAPSNKSNQSQLNAVSVPTISLRRPSAENTYVGGHGRRESIESPNLDPAGNPKVPASRTFDPSTDVDVRKRETQEVLTRFMKTAAGGKQGK